MEKSYNKYLKNCAIIRSNIKTGRSETIYVSKKSFELTFNGQNRKESHPFIFEPKIYKPYLLWSLWWFFKSHLKIVIKKYNKGNTAKRYIRDISIIIIGTLITYVLMSWLKWI